MTLTLILLVFALTQTLDSAIQYDPAADSSPNSLWHRLLGALHRWAADTDEPGHGSQPA